ncbi:zinc ribbon domain-containing protein [Lacunimicrobium album]
MTVSAKDLGHLHNLHIEFQEIVGQLDRGPKRIKAKQQQTAQKMQELDEARATLKQTKVSAEQKNLELKSLETRISSMNGKLNQATSNKEFEAIKGQIMADEMAKSVLEDEGLEILDRVDVAYAKMKECEEALKKAQEEEKLFRDQFDSRAAELNASAKRLESEIVASSKVIPAEFQEQFRRVSANKGADCMAPLINGTCQGCYFNLPAQTVITIKTGHIVFCKSCAALLYPSE